MPQIYNLRPGQSRRALNLTPDQLKLLGTMPDRDLAEQIGCTENTIAKARKRAKLPSIRPTRRREEPDPRSLQRRLSDWPHRLAGVGIDANHLLVALAQSAEGLTITECRTLTRSHPLGALTKHSLAHCAETKPQTRYKLTPKGHEYLALLQHHNLLPCGAHLPVSAEGVSPSPHLPNHCHQLGTDFADLPHAL